jgi:WD40 repeat protein
LTNEIFTNEIPLGDVNYADFIELVAQRNARPERPDNEDAPQLSDEIWGLAEKCWVADPKHRPSAGAICHILYRLVDTANLARQIPVSPPARSTSLSQSMSRPHIPDHACLRRPCTPPPKLTMRGHTAEVHCATFSPDGKYIVSGSEDRTIMVWDAQTGSLASGPFKVHTAAICSVAFSPNSGRIASGSNDNSIVVLRAVNGKVVVGPLKLQSAPIQCVAFSACGRQMLRVQRTGQFEYGMHLLET